MAMKAAKTDQEHIRSDREGETRINASTLVPIVPIRHRAYTWKANCEINGSIPDRSG